MGRAEVFAYVENWVKMLVWEFPSSWSNTEMVRGDKLILIGHELKKKMGLEKDPGEW